MRLLHYANKGRVKTQGGWDFPEWFAVPQAQIMDDLQIKNKHTLYKLRDELVSAGFLEFKNSQGREPPRYRLTVSETCQPRTSQYSAPSGKNIEHYSSFNTEDFFAAAVKATFGEDFDMSLLGK